MKKAFVVVTALLMCFLCACGKNSSSQEFIDIRSKYLGSENIELTAGISADYGDRVYDYTLSYSGNGDKGTVTVLEPDIIKGITVQLDGENAAIDYGGAVIDTGGLYGDGYSPVSVLPLILRAVRSGYVSEVYKENIDGKLYIAAEIDETKAGSSEKTIYTTWFSNESHDLYKAEISVGGYTVLTAIFEEVQKEQ